MRPQILLTCTTVTAETSQNTRDGIRMYFEAVRAAGGEPVEISNDLDDDAIAAAVGKAQGLVLTGGGDVDPAAYGLSNAGLSQGINARRDHTEILAIRVAVQRRLPILGICRGQQVLNVALGGGLLQDIPDHRKAEPGHNDYLTHDILVAPGSLADLWQAADATVNSYHHQSIDPDRVAPALQPIARAPDGVIEAVQGADGSPILAVQFHPERTGHKDAPRTPLLYARLFKWLINNSL